MNRQQTLDAASAAVGERPKSYGSPEQNFDRIAALWNAYLNGKASDPKQPVGATDVAIMLALMKIARLEENPSHADSWVDLAGYAACGAEVSTAEVWRKENYRPGVPREYSGRDRVDDDPREDHLFEDGRRVV